jgi:hypothetical protein
MIVLIVVLLLCKCSSGGGRLLTTRLYHAAARLDRHAIFLFVYGIGDLHVKRAIAPAT